LNGGGIRLERLEITLRKSGEGWPYVAYIYGHPIHPGSHAPAQLRLGRYLNQIELTTLSAVLRVS
jgi:hypothetical protein